MASGESKTFVAANERVLILLLCVVAALRVFVFSAAFPFFSNVDEDLYFDLITQYSHGRVPRSFEPLQDETLNWIVPYASPEFLFTPEQFPGGKFPPPLWKQAFPDVRADIAATRTAWSSEINFESSQPPLYYVLASVWWRINQRLGLNELESLYWIRVLNVLLVAVALVVIISRLLLITRRTPRAGLMAFAAIVICAAIPIGIWMVWTKFQFGDLTGSTAKIALLGWTRKRFKDWWQHPIFTPRGLWIFWSDLMASFWRGEVKWHGQMLRCRLVDGFYAISSLTLLVAALIGSRNETALSTFQRQAVGIAALSFMVSVGFLALLSIQFDFGNCINPSRAHPYFTSGRLLSGALIPFALFYVYGISWILRRINSALPILVLGVLVMFVITSEIKINRAAFESEHNWFHL